MEHPSKKVGTSDAMVELWRLRMMMLIRRFEETIFQVYTQPGQKIGGFAHLCTGQEAIPVGVAEVFRRGVDVYAGQFRGHGWSLALGMTPRAAMAEMYAKDAGCCRGRGGSMHFRDAATRNMGGWATVGGQVPVGVGAAFAAAYRGTGGVAFVVLGDGALAQGVSFEALNLAGLLKVPAVFIVEDNGIALGTKVERHSAEADLVRRGEAYGMPALGLDGNDVEEVIRVVGQAAERARGGAGPSYLVARTFRFRGYSMSDPMKYRTADEMKAAKARDPITVYARRLRERGLLDDAAAERMEAAVTKEVTDAVGFAEGSPNPRLEDRFEDLLAEQYPFRPS